MFFGQNVTFTQNNSVSTVLKIFYFCFQFLQDKMLLLMKIEVLQTMRQESDFRIAPNWP